MISFLIIIFSKKPLCHRARIETKSSISDQSLQCSQGVCERVSNQYFYDDYLQTIAVYKGVKEGNGAFIWEHTQSHPQAQGQSTTFSLPHDLYNLNSFKYSVEESDFFKVHYPNPTLFFSFLPPSFSLSIFILPAFVYELECNVGFGSNQFMEGDLILYKLVSTFHIQCWLS